MTHDPVKIALVGVGAVSDFQHVPGIRADSRSQLVAICDTSEALLAQRQQEWGVARATTDYRHICCDEEIDAVIIATPNRTHPEIGMAAIEQGKHVMCEKPLGLSAHDVRRLYHAARERGVVHMTAFTYRFSPSMRYLREILKTGQLGEPRHFRSQRFLDLPETSWGWRQYKSEAGAGDLFDMTIHRIDLGLDLMGPLQRICGSIAQFAKRDQTSTGESCPPSEVDDWSAIIGQFDGGAVGVWEGTTVAKGYKLHGIGHEWAEVNGSEGTAVYRLHHPNSILLGRHGGDLEEVRVPSTYLRPAGSQRSLDDPHPSVVFRYDMVWEFVSAIVDSRQAVPSFYHGLTAQIVADAVLTSHREGAWVDIPAEPA